MEEQNRNPFDEIFARAMEHLQGVNEQNLKSAIRSELPVLEQAAKLRPDVVQLLVVLGHAYWHINRKQKAEEIFRRVTALDPTNKEATSFKIQNTSFQKRLQDYISGFKALVIEFPLFKDAEEHAKDMRKEFAKE